MNLMSGGCRSTAGAGDAPARSAADGYGASTAAPLLAARPEWSLPVKVLDDVASLGDAELTSAQVTLRWSAGLEQRMGSVGTARAAEALAGALQIAWRTEDGVNDRGEHAGEMTASGVNRPEAIRPWVLQISEVPAAAVAVRQEGSCEGLLRQFALHEAVELSALESEIDRLEDRGRASFRAALRRGEAVSGIDEALAARLSGRAGGDDGDAAAGAETPRSGGDECGAPWGAGCGPARPM